MLLALFVVNVSNGMMWLSYAPVPNYTATFYGVAENDVDWFSLVFFITSLLMGLAAIVILDTCGLTTSLYLGASCNLIGGVIKWVSTISPVLCSHDYQRSGYMVAMIGQTITAFAQPFLLFAPTKLASFWFGPKERAICTSITSIANPVGLAVANIASPYLVSSPGLVPRMLWIYIIPAAMGFVLTLISFWPGRYHSSYPVPGHHEEKQSFRSFLKGLLSVLRNKSFCVLIFVWSVAAGLFNALITLLPQFLCPYGYTNNQSGLWGALMIFVGLIGATVASCILDHTKKFKEVGVVALGLAILCLVWFMEVSILEHQSVNIAFSLCMFGFFALPVIPVCMELGVEITYPIAEATSSGLLWTCAQVVGMVMVLLSNSPLQIELSNTQVPLSQCSVSEQRNDSFVSCLQNISSNAVVVTTLAYDTTYVQILYLACIVVAFVCFVGLFYPVYKRTNSEQDSLCTKIN
ncbi:hypothetical protein EMCRGX_G029732 [Ephydatia muelleri]